MGWKNSKSCPNLACFMVISACLNLVLLFSLLWSVDNLKTSLVSNEVVASIVTNEEDEKFIKQVSKDLGLESEVVMIVGPYYVHSFFSPSQNYRLDRLLSRHPIVIDPEDPTRRILMRESIYIELTMKERRAVLTHEMWHIYSFIKEGRITAPNPDKEVEANRFAIKYVNPDILINLYRRYGDSDPEIKALIDDLERQKL